MSKRAAIADAAGLAFAVRSDDQHYDDGDDGDDQEAWDGEMRGLSFRGDVGHVQHVTILMPQRTSRRAADASDLEQSDHPELTLHGGGRRLVSIH